jgi:hypothetical protein
MRRGLPGGRLRSPDVEADRPRPELLTTAFHVIQSWLNQWEKQKDKPDFLHRGTIMKG